MRAHESARGSAARIDVQGQVATHPIRILLAEDDYELRRLLARILRNEGYEVVEAEDGTRLHDLLTTSLVDRHLEPPDLVLSDVKMPGFSGLRILAGLREANWGMPFVLLTAFGSDGLRTEAVRLGATAILDKPIDPEGLCAVLRTVLAAPDAAAS